MCGGRLIHSEKNAFHKRKFLTKGDKNTNIWFVVFGPTSQRCKSKFECAALAYSPGEVLKQN